MEMIGNGNDLIASTCQWFVAANQMPPEPTPNVRQVAFYMGMQLEELGEKLSVFSPHDGHWVKDLGNNFKNGMFDSTVAAALQDPAKCKDILDGDMDSIWVTIGAARAQGADVLGAFGKVSEHNWDKRWEDGTFHNDPKTGKVLKRPGWVAPDLTPFIHPSLRGEAK